MQGQSADTSSIDDADLQGNKLHSSVHGSAASPLVNSNLPNIWQFLRTHRVCLDTGKSGRAALPLSKAGMMLIHSAREQSAWIGVSSQRSAGMPH